MLHLKIHNRFKEAEKRARFDIHETITPPITDLHKGRKVIRMATHVSHIIGECRGLLGDQPVLRHGKPSSVVIFA